MKEKTQEILDALHEVANDNTIPKNIREKINNIVASLNHADELSLKVDRALHELEEISEDSNLQAYTRTQVWNIVSMLESLHN